MSGATVSIHGYHNVYSTPSRCDRYLAHSYSDQRVLQQYCLQGDLISRPVPNLFYILFLQTDGFRSLTSSNSTEFFYFHKLSCD